MQYTGVLTPGMYLLQLCSWRRAVQSPHPNFLKL
jgi:hypothetical protein